MTGITNIKTRAGDLYNSVTKDKSSRTIGNRKVARGTAGGLSEIKINGFNKGKAPLKTNPGWLGKLNLQGRKKLYFYIGSLILIPLLIFAIGGYIFLNSTSNYSVNIKYKYLNLTEKREITASEDGTMGFQIVKLNDMADTSESASATGEKVKGEKASGLISVFNATSGIVVIKKGTAVTCVSSACNGLVYTTDGEMNLGPGSSSNDLRIVANDIGLNYNLAVNAGRFKIGNYNSNNDLIATNVQQIAGGTAKVISKMVSKQDITAIEAKALENLKSILLSKIRNDPNNARDYIISESSIKIEKLSAQTDPEGTEAESLNTNVSAKATVDAFPKDKIQPVIDDIKKTLAPEGYYLDDRQTTYPAPEVVSSQAGSITVRIQVNSTGRINLDTDQLKKDLGGKGLEEADSILSKVPNTTGYTASYSPSSAPGFLKKVPSDPSRISVNFISEAPE
jgi:hypothetical protein